MTTRVFDGWYEWSDLHGRYQMWLESNWIGTVFFSKSLFSAALYHEFTWFYMVLQSWVYMVLQSAKPVVSEHFSWMQWSRQRIYHDPPGNAMPQRLGTVPHTEPINTKGISSKMSYHAAITQRCPIGIKIKVLHAQPPRPVLCMSTWTQVSPGSSVPQPVNDPASKPGSTIKTFHIA